MHIGILADQSSYFKAALTGGFSEGQSKNITLEEGSDEAIGRIVAWLYGHDIRRTSTDENEPLERVVSDLAFSLLIDVWILADYFVLPKLQNHTIDVMVKKIYRHTCNRPWLSLNIMNDALVSEIRDAVSMLWQRKGGNTAPLKKFFIDIISNPRFLQETKVLRKVRNPWRRGRSRDISPFIPMVLQSTPPVTLRVLSDCL